MNVIFCHNTQIPEALSMYRARAVLKLVLIFLVFASLHLAVPASHAAQVLAVGTEFANVFERNAVGEYTGLGADILRALAKQNGDDIRFEIYPWARAQWMVENEQAQILIGPYKTAEREGKFAFAKRAFYRDLMALYVRKGSEFSWDGNYASLPGPRLGVINGCVYGAHALKLRAIHRTGDDTQLAAGQDGVINRPGHL